MMFFDLTGQTLQGARPSATTLSTAAADIFTSSDFIIPVEIVRFGYRITTASGVAPTTRAKWVIKHLDNDDSTLTNKAFMTFKNASYAVGDVGYADLQDDGRAFICDPGDRVRVSVDTAAVMPGGSASGAAIPWFAYKPVTRNTLEAAYSYVTLIESAAS